MEEQGQDPQISCDLEQFEPVICGPEPTAVLFLGKDSNIEEIVPAVGQLDMSIKVVDTDDEKCNQLREKYQIDSGAQLVVFQGCEKKASVGLDTDPQGQVERLKEELGQPVLADEDQPVFEEDLEPIEEEQPILGAVQTETVQTGEEED